MAPESEDLLFQQPEYNIASVGKRFVNYVMDIIIIYAFIFVVFFILGSIAPGIIIDEAGEINNVTQYTLVYIIWFLYYFVSETLLKGRSIGKFVTNTIAIRNDGNPVTARDAALRSVIRLVPFEAFSTFGGNPWHDRWSKTHVVERNTF